MPLAALLIAFRALCSAAGFHVMRELGCDDLETLHVRDVMTPLDKV